MLCGVFGGGFSGFGVFFYMLSSLDLFYVMYYC